MPFRGIEALTFDCYGTLIDWEQGLVEALAPWLERTGGAVDRDLLLELYGAAESAEEHAHPGRLYTRILDGVIRRVGAELGRDVRDEEAARFAASVPDWPAFDDTPAALAYLKQHFQLAILSNIDHASFAGSRARLGVNFDVVVTAEDVGAYKPEHAGFERLFAELARLGVERGSILHVAQSLYHDIEPANAIGLACVWVNRRHGREGRGATPAPVGEPSPTATVPDLAALVDLHRRSV